MWWMPTARTRRRLLRQPTSLKRLSWSLLGGNKQRLYEWERERLPEQQGRFVLIRGDEVADVRDTYGDALRAGYERYGLDSFLVKLHAAGAGAHPADVPLPGAALPPDRRGR